MHAVQSLSEKCNHILNSRHVANSKSRGRSFCLMLYNGWNTHLHWFWSISSGVHVTVHQARNTFLITFSALGKKSSTLAVSLSSGSKFPKRSFNDLIVLLKWCLSLDSLHNALLLILSQAAVFMYCWRSPLYCFLSTRRCTTEHWFLTYYIWTPVLLQELSNRHVNTSIQNKC